jgi:hypothetical protein
VAGNQELVSGSRLFNPVRQFPIFYSDYEAEAGVLALAHVT